jgi:hypothetical protein
MRWSMILKSAVVHDQRFQLPENLVRAGRALVGSFAIADGGIQGAKLGDALGPSPPCSAGSKAMNSCSVLRLVLEVGLRCLSNSRATGRAGRQREKRGQTGRGELGLPWSSHVMGWSGRIVQVSPLR